MYGQRWQVETVMFMLKQHQGAALTARRYHVRRREMGLMAITHNIMIVRSAELFYKAFLTPFLPPEHHSTLCSPRFIFLLGAAIQPHSGHTTIDNPRKS